MSDQQSPYPAPMPMPMPIMSTPISSPDGQPSYATPAPMPMPMPTYPISPNSGYSYIPGSDGYSGDNKLDTKEIEAIRKIFKDGQVDIFTMGMLHREQRALGAEYAKELSTAPDHAKKLEEILNRPLDMNDPAVKKVTETLQGTGVGRAETATGAALMDNPAPNTNAIDPTVKESPAK